jgi:hypothetical protein
LNTIREFLGDDLVASVSHPARTFPTAQQRHNMFRHACVVI